MQELHVVELAAGPSGDSGRTGDVSPYLLVADETGTTARLRIDDRLFAAVDAARGVEGVAPDGPAVRKSTSSMTTEADMSDQTWGDQPPPPATDRPDARPSGAGHSSAGHGSAGHGSVGRREELPLRPRDIQIRIRAGETAEEIATAANVPLADIQRFEGPVLAERVWMAQRARAVVPRRGEGATTSMGELASERLGSRGVSELDQDWDSWRREDGTWTVRLSWAEGNRGRLACWRYDPVRQTVVAVDDSARELTDPPAPRRLAAVPGDAGRAGDESREASTTARDRVYDLEADGGLHVVGGASRRLQLSDETPAPETSAWPRTAGATTSSESATTLWDDDSPEQGGPEEADGNPEAAVGEVTPSAAPTGAAALEQGEAVEQDDAVEDEPVRQVPISAGGEQSQQSQQGSAEPSKRKKRASVPSWDDILLGSRRSQ